VGGLAEHPAVHADGGGAWQEPGHEPYHPARDERRSVFAECGQGFPHGSLGGLRADREACPVDDVLGRSADLTDAAFQRQLTDQVVRGVLTR
jgi:hypothetical protein